MAKEWRLNFRRIFYIYSIKDNGKKRIYNTEVIEDIKTEIRRLDSGE